MALDITVNLKTESGGSLTSFGIPLILAGGCGEDIPFTKCRTTSDISAAFGLTGSLSTTLGSDSGSAINTAYSAVAEAANLLWSQTGSPRYIAVAGCKADIELSDSLMAKDWRQLIVVNPGGTTAESIAKTINGTRTKIFFTSISVTTDDSTTFEDAYKAAINPFIGQDRTVVMYYDGSVDTPEAALVGASAGKNPGAITYKNLILKGIAPLEISDNDIGIINGADATGCGLTVVTKAGDIVTTEGKAASGEYIDIIDSEDWIIQNIEQECQSVLNNSDKVPYTAVGIAQLESAVSSVLQEAFTNGMIASDEDSDATPMYSTDFAPRSEMSAEKISSRVYDGGSFSFTLAGAIHEAEINGTIIA